MFIVRKKVYEVAKECNIAVNKIVSYLREKGVDVKGPKDTLEESALNIIYEFYGTPKSVVKAREAANQAATAHGGRILYDADGNPIKPKFDENGKQLPITGPVYDEHGRKLVLKKQYYDAAGNPVKRQFDENGKPLPFKEPVYDENGKLVVFKKRVKKDEAEASKQEEKASKDNSVKKEADAATTVKNDKSAEAKPEEKPSNKNVDTDKKHEETKKVDVKKTDENKKPEDNSKADDKKSSDKSADEAKKPAAEVKRPRENVYANRRAQEAQKNVGEKPFNKDRNNNRSDNNGDRRQGGFNKDRRQNNGRQGEGQGGNFNGDRRKPRDGGQQGGSFGNNGFKKQNNNGFSKGGFGGNGFDKDKDSGEKRTFTKKNDSKGGSSIKSDLGKELSRDQRAAAFNDRRREKNKNKDRDFENEDGLKKPKKKDPNRKGAFIMPKPVPKKEEDPNEIKTIAIPEAITVKELADKLKQNATDIVKKLFLAGKMYSINSELTFEEAEEIAIEYEVIVEKEQIVDVVEELMKDTEDAEDTLVERPPVVCVMGHVDHGKTSILDAIRKTNVTSREAGGITQHIGAYMVEINGKKITFLDTPGHEAFTAMRLRGAMSTDIAVLVVAADDGVMPQTVEAINHAKAAGVQIVVAINKMDREGANPDRVMTELSEHGLVAEAWGGDTVMVPVSAKTGDGINDLLEMILLTADMLELKANPNRNGRGIVIEAKLDKGRGPVATVLVKKGTIKVGDLIAVGHAHGKIRAMLNENGQKVKVATPSMPVEILGLNAVPNSGDEFVITENEKKAREIAEAFIAQSKEKLVAETKSKLSLDGLFDQIQAGKIKELNVIIKADVQGSVEAMKQSLLKLSDEEVAVRVIHSGAGNINESDVTLASASNAIIIGFNVKPDNAAKDSAEKEHVDLRLYSVIYNAIDDIEAALNGLLDPIYEERVIGHAEIRQIFKASGVGNIAGSYVTDGKVVRGCKVRIYRREELIHEGTLASLKRFKDDAKEVNAGYECGLVFDKFSEITEGDTVEFYNLEEVPRNREKKQR
jgi:translation initiation factor IF-2